MSNFPISITACSMRGKTGVSVHLYEADSAIRERLEPAVVALATALSEATATPLSSVRFVVSPDSEFERGMRGAVDGDK